MMEADEQSFGSLGAPAVGFSASSSPMGQA